VKTTSNVINKEKGDMAALRFKQWLDHHNMPYWFIQQDVETFSSSLKKYFGSKRADFMILLPNLGFIFVDVKHRKSLDNGKAFGINLDEVESFLNLQRHFNLQVWFVVSNETYQYDQWFWIPTLKVIEVGKQLIDKQGVKFFKIHREQFIELSHDDSLGNLFLKYFIGKNKN
jgi:hypothetical protein